MIEAGPLVLVVEDDNDLREMIAAMLEDGGYRTVAARDGWEALARVTEAMPALILLDMRMAGMDGREFARRFREQYGHAAPLVAVTAAWDARTVAAEIKADGHLAKPFDMDELLAVVAHHLRPSWTPR